jgi:hypothetical protein
MKSGETIADSTSFKKRRMIVPFADQRDRTGKISYGVSSYGYDFRLSTEFKIPEFEDARILDPKKMDQIRFANQGAAKGDVVCYSLFQPLPISYHTFMPLSRGFGTSFGQFWVKSVSLLILLYLIH